MDKFPILCGVSNCTYRIQLTGISHFLLHLKKHFQEFPRYIYLKCPRCYTVLYKLHTGHIDKYNFNLKRGWNHVANLQRECVNPSAPVMFIHFIVDCQHGE